MATKLGIKIPVPLTKPILVLLLIQLKLVLATLLLRTNDMAALV